jgi:hypothetical protein
VIRKAVCAAPLGLGGACRHKTFRPPCSAASLADTVNLYAVRNSYRGILQGNESYSMTVSCIFGISLLILRFLQSLPSALQLRVSFVLLNNQPPLLHLFRR